MRDEKGRFLKGHKQPEKSKRKMRDNAKINPNFGMRGKHHSGKTKIKMREAKKGEKSSSWKGGKIIRHGYVLVSNPDHPHCDVRGYVRQARLIAEKALGRPLRRPEIVHHRNGKKDDDRWNNLFVFESNPDHIRYEWFLRRK